MHVLPKYHRLRILLKYLHIIASCVWLGAGFSVMVLLVLNRRATTADQLFALNFGIKYLDDYLIVPAAAGCLLSGFVICVIANLGVTSCRWVVTKWTITLAAALFGAVCLAPWMKRLAALCNGSSPAVFIDPRYWRAYHLDVAFGTLQTAVLLYLMLISVLKPCNTYHNCVHCRERFGGGECAHKVEAAGHAVGGGG
jgi:uncharacterized membrane protein